MRSVWFEEPVQVLQLVEEETAKLLPHSDEDSRDDNGSTCFAVSDDMYDISQHEESGSDSDSNYPPYFPKWEENTLSFMLESLSNHTSLFGLFWPNL